VSVLYAVGIGASGAAAAARVDAAVDAIDAVARVRGRSRAFANPAWGGATRAPFVNACVVVESPWSAPALMAALHALERQAGRVRAQKNIARTLDLDLLWSAGLPTSTPQVPHPRLRARAFAVIPLVEALADAGVVVPVALAAAAARLGLTTPMVPVPVGPQGGVARVRRSASS
jgi:2-amino-4-hydroxy-6-hydroxymethyldihydropteridine diphosphokinase